MHKLHNLLKKSLDLSFLQFNQARLKYFLADLNFFSYINSIVLNHVYRELYDYVLTRAVMVILLSLIV